MAELVPIKCPVCGAPIDRGATKCKYCETSYYHDVHYNTPDDIDVFYDEDEYAVQIAADDFEFYLFNYDADSGIEVSDTDEKP